MYQLDFGITLCKVKLFVYLIEQKGDMLMYSLWKGAFILRVQIFLSGLISSWQGLSVIVNKLCWTFDSFYFPKELFRFNNALWCNIVYYKWFLLLLILFKTLVSYFIRTDVYDVSTKNWNNINVRKNMYPID